MAEEQNIQQAGWSMDLATLQRINLELNHCNESIRQGAMTNWWNALLNLYKETDNFLDKEQKKVHEELMESCALAVKEWQDYQNNYASTPLDRRGRYQPPQEIFHTLFKWELLLRNALDKAGLLMKKAETGYGQMV